MDNSDDDGDAGVELDPLPTGPMDIGEEEEEEEAARPVLSIQRLRPTRPPSHTQPITTVAPFTVLEDAAAGTFPFVYAAADTPATAHALEKRLGSPVFCHLALQLLQPDEADIEWMARFLAYMRASGRFELPNASSAVGGGVMNFRRAADAYQRSVPGLVLIAQEDGGQDWPNHGRIYMWVHAQQTQPLWHVLATMFAPAQWMGAPLFWMASRMETALKDEPVYLEFWRATFARFQSRLNAL
jgi:hypothetical protein